MKASNCSTSRRTLLSVAGSLRFEGDNGVALFLNVGIPFPIMFLLVVRVTCIEFDGEPTVSPVLPRYKSQEVRTSSVRDPKPNLGQKHGGTGGPLRTRGSGAGIAVRRPSGKVLRSSPRENIAVHRLSSRWQCGIPTLRDVGYLPRRDPNIGRRNWLAHHSATLGELITAAAERVAGLYQKAAHGEWLDRWPSAIVRRHRMQPESSVHLGPKVQRSREVGPLGWRLEVVEGAALAPPALRGLPIPFPRPQHFARALPASCLHSSVHVTHCKALTA